MFKKLILILTLLVSSFVYSTAQSGSQTITYSSSSITFNPTTYLSGTVTLTGNLQTFVLVNGTTRGQTYSMSICQDNAGGRVINFGPSNFSGSLELYFGANTCTIFNLAWLNNTWATVSKSYTLAAGTSSSGIVGLTSAYLTEATSSTTLGNSPISDSAGILTSAESFEVSNNSAQLGTDDGENGDLAYLVSGDGFSGLYIAGEQAELELNSNSWGTVELNSAPDAVFITLYDSDWGSGIASSATTASIQISSYSSSQYTMGDSTSVTGYPGFNMSDESGCLYNSSSQNGILWDCAEDNQGIFTANPLTLEYQAAGGGIDFSISNSSFKISGLPTTCTDQPTQTIAAIGWVQDVSSGILTICP